MFRLLLFFFISFIFLKASILEEGIRAFENKNYVKAVRLFSLSCKQNNMIACYNLALCYSKGLGVEKDLLLEGYFLKKACDADLKDACFNLGVLYEEKLNNKLRAKEYYNKACLLGDKDACFNLAHLLENSNLSQSIKLYELLCKYNYSRACVSLGTIYEEKLHRNNDAVFLYRKACNLGSKDGCYNVGLRYLKDKDYFKSLKYFSKACLYSDGESCFNVGVIYFAGPSKIRNDKNAFKFFKKSCELNYAKGCDMEGFLYEFGKGIDVNLNKALFLYKKSCEMNYSKGCKDFKRLNNKINK
jgi:TPR repeat protein